MTKSIVRDVDIRLGANIITEPALAKVTSASGAEVKFTKIVEVKSEEELYDAIKNDSANRAILIKGNIVAIRPLNLTKNDIIIGGNTTIDYVGRNTGVKVRTQINPQITSTLSYVENDISNNISGVNHGKVKVFYDNVEYDSIEFIKNKEELLKATDKRNIIILDSDIDLNSEKSG